MAAVTQTMFDARDGQAVVTMTYDDANGAISRLDWTVLSGTLNVTIHRQGQADVVRQVTSSGGMNVPAGYTLTKSTKDGSWYWAGTIGADFDWAAPAAAATKKQ